MGERQLRTFRNDSNVGSSESAAWKLSGVNEWADPTTRTLEEARTILVRSDIEVGSNIWHLTPHLTFPLQLELRHPV